MKPSWELLAARVLSTTSSSSPGDLGPGRMSKFPHHEGHIPGAGGASS